MNGMVTNKRTVQATVQNLEASGVNSVRHLTQHAMILQNIENSRPEQLTELLNLRRDMTSRLNRLESTIQRHILSLTVKIVRETLIFILKTQ